MVDFTGKLDQKAELVDGREHMVTKYADPTQEDLENPLFDAIWGVIKGWDIGEDPTSSMRTGALGNHAAAILNSVIAVMNEMAPIIVGAIQNVKPGSGRIEFVPEINNPKACLQTEVVVPIKHYDALRMLHALCLLTPEEKEAWDHIVMVTGGDSRLIGYVKRVLEAAEKADSHIPEPVGVAGKISDVDREHEVAVHSVRSVEDDTPPEFTIRGDVIHTGPGEDLIESVKEQRLRVVGESPRAWKCEGSEVRAVEDFHDTVSRGLEKAERIMIAWVFPTEGLPENRRYTMAFHDMFRAGCRLSELEFLALLQGHVNEELAGYFKR